MYKDYSLGCVDTIGKNRNRKHKKKTFSAAKEFFPAIKLIWHAFGIMLLISLVIGVTSTVWYGWQVQSALDDIGQAASVKKNLASKNQLLTVKHDLMLSEEYMTNAAKKQGLSLPTKNQLRYP